MLTLMFALGGCEATPAPDASATAAAALKGDPVPVPVQRSVTPDRHVHRVPGGTCVTVVPPPPAWAYRADGTLKEPSEIHRHKDGAEQVLFLNFDGPHMEPGDDNPENNQSHIPNSPVDVPAFDHTPFARAPLETREQVIDAIVRWVTYYYAHMNVRVTATRPPAGTAYTMMVIGGSPQIIGEQTGVLGIATFDCYQDQRNVGFVFSEDHSSRLEMLVLTIVHEAGHTFGLAHINDDRAIMYPANPGSDAYWGTGSTTDSYACDGGFSQDSFAVLQEMLGARDDLIPPWVEIQTPGQGAIVSSTVDAVVHGSDNVVLAAVELFVDGNSVGAEDLPSFVFQVLNLPDGPHEIWAVGEDAHGNQAQSDTITVEVQSDCGALATCEPGLGAIGDPCASGDACQSGVCAQTLEGSAVCSRPCDGDSPCPFGTFCVAGETNGTDVTVAWCAVGSAPAVLLQTDEAGARLSGCATGSGSGAWIGLVLLVLLALRRRR